MRPLSSFVGQPIRSLQTMLRVIAEDVTPVFYQRCGCSLSCIDMYYFWICAIFSVLFLL